MKTIAKLENKLAVLMNSLNSCTDENVKSDLKEQIEELQFEIDDMIEAEADAMAYEEMTGTTPQDLYNERNSYALHQSDMYDRFRNEY